MNKGIFEAIINLNDFSTLENTVEMVNFYEERETGYTDCNIKGYLRVSKQEFSEVMAENLKYEIEENNNINPQWIFEYEFTVAGLIDSFNVKDVKKFEDDYVYFEVV